MCVTIIIIIVIIIIIIIIIIIRIIIVVGHIIFLFPCNKKEKWNLRMSGKMALHFVCLITTYLD